MLTQFLRRTSRVLTLASKASPFAMVGTWYAYSAASDPDRFPYDLSFVRTATSIVGTSVGRWLSKQRPRAAFAIDLVTGVSSGLLSVLQVKRHGCYVTSAWPKDAKREKIFNQIMPAVHAGIGLLGMIAPLTPKHLPSVYPSLRMPTWLVTLWPRLRRLGLYYMAFSLIGHWGEIAFCMGIKHGIVKGGYDRSNHMLWDQWLFPFPAEGTVAVLMALFLYPAKQVVHKHFDALAQNSTLSLRMVLPAAVAVTFLLNQVVCTSIDYLTGMVANRNYELWDYRDMKFNFQGQICLQNSLIYSILATWASWRLFPRMESLLDRMGPTREEGLFVGLGSLFIFLELLYHVLPPGAGEQGSIWDNPDEADEVAD